MSMRLCLQYGRQNKKDFLSNVGDTTYNTDGMKRRKKPRKCENLSAEPGQQHFLDLNSRVILVFSVLRSE